MILGHIPKASLQEGYLSMAAPKPRGTTPRVQHTILHDIILYCTVVYYTILYSTLLCAILLYFTILAHPWNLSEARLLASAASWPCQQALEPGHPNSQDLGVFTNQGHLVWTQNNRIPHVILRTPKWELQFLETPNL